MIKSNTGYVYLINEVDTNNYKIGISKNPANEGRIKNLQTGNHNELVIVYGNDTTLVDYLNSFDFGGINVKLLEF